MLTSRVAGSSLQRLRPRGPDICALKRRRGSDIDCVRSARVASAFWQRYLGGCGAWELDHRRCWPAPVKLEANIQVVVVIRRPGGFGALLDRKRRRAEVGQPEHHIRRKGSASGVEQLDDIGSVRSYWPNSVKRDPPVEQDLDRDQCALSEPKSVKIDGESHSAEAWHTR